MPDLEEDIDDESTESTIQDKVQKEAPEYVEIVDPSALEISFIKSECPQRKVIKIVCDHLGNMNIY